MSVPDTDIPLVPSNGPVKVGHLNNMVEITYDDNRIQRRGALYTGRLSGTLVRTALIGGPPHWSTSVGS